MDSSLRTLNSDGENRNSQQIVDNLEEAEEENKMNNNSIEQKKSEEINLENNKEKLTTLSDVITGNNYETKNSENLNKDNNSEENVK